LSLHLLALEKQWRELRQIAPPDGPTVVAFGDDQFVLDAALLEQLGEIAIGLDEEVVLAAADPDQLNFALVAFGSDRALPSVFSGSRTAELKPPT
jgi:hypothetical protein